jgi:hypothetical protein
MTGSRTQPDSTDTTNPPHPTAADNTKKQATLPSPARERERERHPCALCQSMQTADRAVSSSTRVPPPSISPFSASIAGTATAVEFAETDRKHVGSAPQGEFETVPGARLLDAMERSRSSSSSSPSSSSSLEHESRKRARASFPLGWLLFCVFLDLFGVGLVVPLLPYYAANLVGPCALDAFVCFPFVLLVVNSCISFQLARS